LPSGGSIGTRFSYYRHNLFVNSAITNYSITTLNLHSLLTYRLPPENRVSFIELAFYMPAAAFIIRPDYAYILPSGFIDHDSGTLKSIVNSVEFASFDQFFGLRSDLSYTYHFKSNNALRIGYNWEFSNHREENQLQSASHGIRLQTLINF
jgi:hypothetical protein